MTRLTREQSRALTRQRLINSAADVLAQYSYDGASVERIAESAGYSKGAFYSNFSSKEDILDHLLSSHAGQDVKELSYLLNGTDDPEDVINIVAAWSDRRAAERKWGLIAIEYLRRAHRDGTLSDDHRAPFIAQWQDVGTLLCEKLFPQNRQPIEPLDLGGLVLDLTYGGLAVFLQASSSGKMLRSVLWAMVRDSRASAEG